MMKQIRRFLQQDEGAVMVEMTVVMPFIFVLTYGIWEFGNVLYQHNQIATGVRDAARFLSRFPPEAGDLLTVGGPVAAQIAVTGEPVVGGVNRVSWWNVGDVDIDIDDTLANPRDPVTGERDYRGGDNITIITVSTTVSYGGVGFLSLLNYGNPALPGISAFDITLSHQERYMSR